MNWNSSPLIESARQTAPLEVRVRFKLIFSLVEGRYVMPLFHQRIKPRSCLGPLIVGSLGKNGKKIDQWGGRLDSGINYRSASGRPRRPQTVPNWSGTKNRLSHFSSRRQTDWVPGRLRPPGTKPRLTQD